MVETRLRRNADFQRVRQEGRSWSNRSLVLNAARNNLPQSRFGFALGKRLGNAVVRNRLKRRLRELVRLRLKAHTLKAGYDVVIIGRAPAVEMEWEALGAALDDLLRRASLIVPPTDRGGAS